MAILYCCFLQLVCHPSCTKSAIYTSRALELGSTVQVPVFKAGFFFSVLAMAMVMTSLLPITYLSGAHLMHCSDVNFVAV